MQEILNRLRMEGSSSLDELALYFGVSTATIRRDIKFLERDESVVQTVGGGILYRTSNNGSVTALGTDDASIDRKIRIAEYCTDLVREGDEIIVAPGSTATMVGRILTGISDRPFRLLTCSLDLALDSGSVPNVETVILGGEVVGRYSEGFSGRDDYFSSCHSRHTLILSADGVDAARGLTLFSSDKVALLKKMIAASETIVVVAISDKIGRTFMNSLCAIDTVSMLVTDVDVPVASCAAIRDRGVPVVTV